MAALLFQTDWTFYGYRSNPICGFFLISGIYQLEPLLSTTVNIPICLTRSSAKDLSPLLIEIPQSSNKCLIVVISSENDSPAFRNQSKRYYEYTKKFSIPTIFLNIPEVDHFDIIEKLIHNGFILSKSIIQTILSRTLSIYSHGDLSLFISDL